MAQIEIPVDDLYDALIDQYDDVDPTAVFEEALNSTDTGEIKEILSDCLGLDVDPEKIIDYEIANDKITLYTDDL